MRRSAQARNNLLGPEELRLARFDLCGLPLVEVGQGDERTRPNGIAHQHRHRPALPGERAKLF